MIWQYTATDVYSALTRAFLRSTHKDPSAEHTSALAHIVAHDLASRGWQLKKLMTDTQTE